MNMSPHQSAKDTAQTTPEINSLVHGEHDSALARDAAAFFAIVGRIFRHRRYFVIAALLAAVLTIALMHILPSKYTATVGVMPTITNQLAGQNSSALTSGLASLLQAGQTMVPAHTQFLAEISSFAVAERMAQDPDISPVLFPNEWSAKIRTWHPSTGIFAQLVDVAKVTLGLPGWTAPNADRLSDFIARKVEVDQDATTGITTITFDWYDPAFAKLFLARLVSYADSDVRQRDTTRAKLTTDFIDKHLAEITQVDQREGLMQIWDMAERTYILGNIGVPYAGDLFDGPIASVSPTKPKFILVAIASLAICELVAILLAIFRTSNGLRGIWTNITGRVRDNSRIQAL